MLMNGTQTMKSDMGEMQKLDLNKERAVGFVEAVRTAARNKRPTFGCRGADCRCRISRCPCRAACESPRVLCCVRPAVWPVPWCLGVQLAKGDIAPKHGTTFHASIVARAAEVRHRVA
jgi:hypothetical protein